MLKFLKIIIFNSNGGGCGSRSIVVINHDHDDSGDNIFMMLFLFTVPASIIDELSSNDMIVQEGDTVVLVCNVTGVPQPEVRWSRRSAGSKMAEGESKTCTVRSIPGPGSASFSCPCSDDS